MTATDRTIVLTSGAWHGTWCWNDVIPHLVGHGARVVAIEFDGFGGTRGASPAARSARPFDPFAFATESSRVADLTVGAIADSFNARIHDIAEAASVTVVGHSLGGVILAEAIERRPDLYASVTYVAAVVPVAGVPAGAYNLEPEQHGSLLPSLIAADPAAVGAIRCDFGDPAKRDATVRAFGLESIGQRADAIISMLTSDVPAGADAAVTVNRARSGQVPHTYVRCDLDAAVRPALQDRIVRELNAVLAHPVDVRPLTSGHSPFFTQPKQLADILLNR